MVDLVNIVVSYLDDNKIKKPHYQCERVSHGLLLHLKSIGIDAKIRVAEIDSDRFDGETSYDVIEHHFIMVGRKVLDATASQFKGMPRVYFGSLPIWY